MYRSTRARCALLHTFTLSHTYIFIYLGKMKFPAFPFPEFESVQTIKLATSKITFVFLISTIHIYLSFVSEAFEEYI